MSSKDTSGSTGNKGAMTSSDAARIQSSTAKSGGDMSSGGFPARAQSAAATNENAGKADSGNNGGAKKN